MSHTFLLLLFLVTSSFSNSATNKYKNNAEKPTLKLFAVSPPKSLLAQAENLYVKIILDFQLDMNRVQTVQTIRNNLATVMAMPFVTLNSESVPIKLSMNAMNNAIKNLQTYIKTADKLEKLITTEAYNPLLLPPNTTLIINSPEFKDHVDDLSIDIANWFVIFTKINKKYEAYLKYEQDKTEGKTGITVVTEPGDEVLLTNSFILFQRAQQLEYNSLFVKDLSKLLYAEILAMTNYMIPPTVIGRLDELNPPNVAAEMNRPIIEACDFRSHYLECHLAITMGARKITINEIIPIPFRINQINFKLDFGYEPILYMLENETIADGSYCSVSKQNIECEKEIVFENNECLENILSNETEKIATSCVFKVIAENYIPFIDHVSGRSIIAQLSDTPVYIRVGGKTVTPESVDIAHHDEVHVGYGTGSLARNRVLPGNSAYTVNSIEYLTYSQELLETFTMTALEHFANKFWKFLPGWLEDPIMISSILAQIIVGCFSLCSCVWVYRKIKSYNTGARPTNNRRNNDANRPNTGRRIEGQERALRERLQTSRV